MIIAAVRKWQAFGMLVSEMSVSRAAGGERTPAIRAVISQTLFVAGCAGLLLYLLVLSSALLPSRNLLAVLAVVLAGTVVLLRRAFIKVHSKVQIALQQTLSEPPAQRREGESRHGDGRGQVAETPALPALLREAQLVMVQVSDDSPVAGKLIAEIQLRTLTGASIVGIERMAEGANVINPGVSEELKAGDTVLLLGTEGQIVEAKKVFGG
nr:TrkA C-terminal domain-containing protein [Verrucomicrobium spinosum]